MSKKRRLTDIDQESSFLLESLGLQAVFAALPERVSAVLDSKVLFALADLIADQRTGSRAANGSESAAKDGISGYTAQDCACARADLCIGGVGSTASQGNQGDGSG
ncbi:hypothetical protein IWX87_000981 [Polaromonas sp. CG_9.7]|nr:hypothetical protein [Polaromonas sp. CG_9.7]MBG6113234.1 hypothetical protein [Polaromonas sp. CG_9.2]MDH6185766.1 hypothetical protein [Polaromonas sp. CG_23.6]